MCYQHLVASLTVTVILEPSSNPRTGDYTSRSSWVLFRMREPALNSSRDRKRNGSRGSTSNPQRSRRSGATALASNEKLRKVQTEASVTNLKMALTCKVQYLDDTDPFASTNFPEPTRPPTYTFHLNIPLCQQVDGLHRLLCAPHAVRQWFYGLFPCSFQLFTLYSRFILLIISLVWI